MESVDSVFLSRVYEYVKRKVREEDKVDLIPPSFLIYRMETAEDNSLLSSVLKRALKEKVFFDSYAYEKETLERVYENLKNHGLLTPLSLGLSDKFVDLYALEGNELKGIDVIGILIASRMDERVLSVLKRRYGIDEEKVYSILEGNHSEGEVFSPLVSESGVSVGVKKRERRNNRAARKRR